MPCHLPFGSTGFTIKMLCSKSLILLMLVCWSLAECYQLRPANLSRMLLDGSAKDVSSTPTPPETAKDKCKAAARESVCSDCRSVQQCVKLGDSWIPTNVENCQEPTPFCKDGKCTKETVSCPLPTPQPSTDFVCVGGTAGVDYFPDATNCSRYHFCDGNTAYDFQCRNSAMAYDYSKTTCVPKTQSNCFTFSCTPSTVGKYITYGPDPRVFGLCTSEGVVLSKCAQSEIVDTTTGYCVPYCASAGNLEDSSDETQYYSCEYIASNVLSKPILSKCPGASKFDKSLGRCKSSS